jgi:hypothetical protein
MVLGKTALHHLKTNEALRGGLEKYPVKLNF